MQKRNYPHRKPSPIAQQRAIASVKEMKAKMLMVQPMTYVIKYTDQYGDWFLERAGMWSDTFCDATHFETKDEADDMADVVRARMTTHTEGVPGQTRSPRVKVIKMRGMQ